jgi:GTP pyrophosphokinase
VASAIAEAGSNIDNVNMDEERGMYTTMQFTIQVGNRQHLARVMRNVRRVPDVVRISRQRD